MEVFRHEHIPQCANARVDEGALAGIAVEAILLSQLLARSTSTHHTAINWEEYMTPLFDQNCDLAAWFEPGRHIFDPDMNWVAFEANGHIWSAATGNWLGQGRRPKHP